MILRGYQSRAVNFLLPLKRGFVVAPAGSGKTLIAASAASSVFRPFDRVVWLANTREQVQQAKDAIGKVTWPNPVEIEVRSVAGKPDLSDADIVIVDECFPAGTVIDGRPIESIRIGEHVRTLNHQTQQIESRPVLSVFERQYDGAMYRCSTRSGRSFVCTEGHPIYVRGVGYVPAKALHGLWKSVSETLQEQRPVRLQVLQYEVRGPLSYGQGPEAYAETGVQGLREGSGRAFVKQGEGSPSRELRLLLPCMQEAVHLETLFGNHEGDQSQAQALAFRQNETEEPHQDAGRAGKDICIEAREDVSCAWGERSVDGSAGETGRTHRTAHGIRCHNRGGSQSLQVGAALLQSGSGVPGGKAGDRGRWQHPQNETLEVLGCSQDGDPEFDRLDCVEVLEQGSGRRRAGVRGESRVYNLHVEGNENYFAGGVLVHNCHHLPALSWSEVVIKANGIVWGFSATPWSGDWQRDDSLRAFFEGNFITIPRSEVLEGGSITPGIVHTHDLDHEGEFQAEIDQQASVLVADRRRRFRFTPIHELQRRALWEVTQQKVRLNPRRNQRIIELANQGQGVLVLVGSIEHGELLSSQISDSVVVHSKMGLRKRKAAIEAARHGTLRCMVATSLADEGLDVPRLETVILAAGGRSAGKLEQRTGRVMRPSEGKLRGVVHDFVDRGASLAHSQFKARMRTYKKLGYTIQK